MNNNTKKFRGIIRNMWILKSSYIFKILKYKYDPMLLWLIWTIIFLFFRIPRKEKIKHNELHLLANKVNLDARILPHKSQFAIPITLFCLLWTTCQNFLLCNGSGFKTWVLSLFAKYLLQDIFIRLYKCSKLWLYRLYRHISVILYIKFLDE